MKKIIFIFVIFLFMSSYACANELAILTNKVKEEQLKFSKMNLQNIDDIKKMIHQMYRTDQGARIAMINDPKIQDLIKEMDKFHIVKMKEILQVYGWVTISKFGKIADHEAWLLVQHADQDPLFQTACLFILEKLSAKGETDLKNYSYLYDRVTLNNPALGIKQKYGTQAEIMDNGEVSIYPYEGNLQELDARRKKMGLNTLEEYINILKQTYKK